MHIHMLIMFSEHSMKAKKDILHSKYDLNNYVDWNFFKYLDLKCEISIEGNLLKWLLEMRTGRIFRPGPSRRVKGIGLARSVRFRTGEIYLLELC